MSSDRDNLLREKMADAIFSYAGACHIENIGKEIDDIDADKIVNPGQKELDQAIRNAIRKYRRRQRYQSLLKTAKTASKITAVILAAVILLSTILITSVDALRIRFLNMLIENGEDYSKITLEKGSRDNGSIDILSNSEELENCYIPAYIPENFTVEKIMDHNGTIIIIFKDMDSNSFIFEQSEDLNREYMVDTENAHTEKVSIQGQEARIIIKDKIITVLWENNEKFFNVYGQVDREEILKFCESLYLKK